MDVVAAYYAYYAYLPEQFAEVRQCESSGNYQVDTGNGYYGAYRFDEPTWLGLGYSSLLSWWG